MNPDNYHQIVASVASKIFEKPVSLADNFLDMGGDSLLAVELAQALEDRLRVEVTTDDIFGANTFGDLVEMLYNAEPAFGVIEK